MSVSIDDVMKAFKALGGNLVHNQALQARLRKEGFDVTEIVDVINEAIESDHLSIDKSGQLSAKSTDSTTGPA